VVEWSFLPGDERLQKLLGSEKSVIWSAYMAKGTPARDSRHSGRQASLCQRLTDKINNGRQRQRVNRSRRIIVRQKAVGLTSEYVPRFIRNADGYRAATHENRKLD